MNIKRRHRIALAAASVGMTAGLMTIALPLVPQVVGADMAEMAMGPMGPVIPNYEYYGAIAYSPTGVWGRAGGYPFQSQANQVALERCGQQDCRVIIGFNKCGAVAYDGVTYIGGRGDTLAMAEADALNRLDGGKIVNWLCLAS
jgi:hypothetical protein